MKECTGCRREALKQFKCPRCQGTGNEPQVRAVEVWACPNDECRNYYASSNAGDLAAQMNMTTNQREPTYTRARCPDCGNERVSCPTIILVPQKGADDAV